MNEEKFKEQYRAGRLRAEAQKSKPEGFLENLSPSEKKARNEGYYEAKNELKQKAKNEVRDSLTRTSSDYDDSYNSYSSGSGSGEPDSFGKIVVTLLLVSAAGALLFWLGWLGVTGAATFSLVWFLSVISGFLGICLLLPLAAIVLCIAIVLAVIALGIFIVYLIIMLIVAIVQYFANNLY